MKKNEGFTLVELLISFTLLTIVLIYLIKATTNIMTRENEVLMLQEYNVFESTLLNNVYDDTDGLTDLKVEEDNGELNIRVGNSNSIYKNISFTNNEDEKGIYYDNVLYEFPTNTEFNSSKYYSLKTGTYIGDNYIKNYSIISIFLVMNNKNKTINIIFQNADQNKLVEGSILEKAQDIVYDNGVCKTDGTTYNYMGGCYAKGTNSSNYVWYNGFMWRIMGINGDNSVRLITDENVTTIPYGSANTALTYKTNEGYINDWLNNYFYENLNSTKSIIQKGNYFCSETTNDTTLTEGRTSCTTNNIVNAKIGTISLDEYLLAGDANSYLNIGQNSWTMTPNNSANAWNTHYKVSEKSIDAIAVTNPDGVRPVINVTSTSKVTKGTGTSNDYYVLVENKTDNKSGTIENTTTSGEYVKINDKVYRVVSKDSDGVKVILDGYYENKIAYGKDNTFSTSSGIGKSLNTDVLSDLGLSNSSIIVSTTWYPGKTLSSGFKYTDSLDQTDKVTAKVGLIRLGDILSNNSSTMLSKNYTTESTNTNLSEYWTISRYSSTGNLKEWRIGTSGRAGSSLEVTNTSGVRPVIKIKNGIQISKGTGTYDNPLELQNNGYTITFDTDGGTSIANQIVEEGKKVTKPSNPSKSGYTFVKWTLNGNDYSFTEKVTSNITLKAVYKKESVCLSNKTQTTSSNIICKRANTLHIEECTRSSCSEAGYTSTGSKGTSTVTYGNCGTKGILTSGDAFDCDVNGDGMYDEKTERFYYVSDYFNTSTKSFESDTATLIYYNDVSGGVVSSSTEYAYDSSGKNWYGPVTAKEQLPTKSQWSNVSLKNSSRTIINENGGNTTEGGTLPNNFSYAGYSTRLLTIQEIAKACNITVGSGKIGELNSCDYLMENTTYSSNVFFGYWLETPRIAGNSRFDWYAWSVGGSRRAVTYGNVPSKFGVRPAIEVSKAQINY